MSKNMEIAWLYDFYGDMLTEKQRQVFALYYEEDLSLAEIAENQNITRQGVRDSLKRAEAQMLDMEDRLHLAGRFRELREGYDAICEAAGIIREVNGHNAREVDAQAQRIVAIATELRER